MSEGVAGATRREKGVSGWRNAASRRMMTSPPPHGGGYTEAPVPPVLHSIRSDVAAKPADRKIWEQPAAHAAGSFVIRRSGESPFAVGEE